MSGWKEQIAELTTKGWFLFAGSIFMGIVGMVGHAIQAGKKISVWAWLGKLAVAFFIGFLSGLWAKSHITEQNHQYIFVSACTAMSGEIMGILVTLNWRNILQNIYHVFTKKP